MAKIIPFEKVQQLYNSYKEIAKDYGVTNKCLTSTDIAKINSIIDNLPDKDVVKTKYNLYPLFVNINQ
jgi:hypothetical protein